MHAFLAEHGIESGALIKALFEPSLIALFVACLWHSFATHGAHRTVREFVGGFALTALAESTGVLSGAYVYPGFEFYVLATPVVNPASWVALVYVLMEVSNRLVWGPRALDPSDPGKTRDLHEDSSLLFGGGLLQTVGLLACVDASLALTIDLVLDPIATIYNLWIWVPSAPEVHTVVAGTVQPFNFDEHVWMATPDNALADLWAPAFADGFRYPTRLLGIPLINFIAWWVFVFVYAAQFRFIETRREWAELRKTLVLWGLVLVDWPILAFLLITPNL